MKCGSEKALRLYDSGPQIQVSRAAGVLQPLSPFLLQKHAWVKKWCQQHQDELTACGEEIQSFDSGATMEKTVNSQFVASNQIKFIQVNILSCHIKQA